MPSGSAPAGITRVNDLSDDFTVISEGGGCVVVVEVGRVCVGVVLEPGIVVVVVVVVVVVEFCDGGAGWVVVIAGVITGVVLVIVWGSRLT